MTDKELIDRITNNDKQAFRTLVDTYSNLVYRTCYGFINQADDAEDVAQEVFIEIFLSLQKFRGEAKISTWLYRIAVNKSLNYIRKNNRKKLFQSIESFFKSNDDSTEFEIESLNATTADSKLENAETGKIVKKAINQLPENQKIAFILSKQHDLSYTEIAEVMKISVSSVESLIFRAKKSLQKKLILYYKDL